VLCDVYPAAGRTREHRDHPVRSPDYRHRHGHPFQWPGRSTLYYRYEIGGHAYTGTGGPEHPSEGPPYTNGTTFEIRYSTAHPSFSTAQNPWTVFGQFLVGCLFLLWADFMAVRQKKETRSQPLSSSNDKTFAPPSVLSRQI